MARTAEVVTQKSLNEMFASATSHFDKAEAAKRIAKLAESIPEAHAALLESVTLHEQEAFKFVRKIQNRIVAKLAEDSPKLQDVAALLKLTADLFPKA